jgi:hypothetical protein
MNRSALTFVTLSALLRFAYAGPEPISGKEMKQVVPPPCPEWYRDTEWNVSIWGTYLFTGNDWEDDEYIQSDHGWGGGVDAKFFFHRYFGIGIEGWAANARREVLDLSGVGLGPLATITHDDRFIGAVKGTFTIRYPIPCSRFAPYIWGGAGVIFGGGETEELIFTPVAGAPGFFSTVHHDGDAELLGQVGAGFEVRLTPHIGLINDFSWNFVAHDNSDFGMVRSGINFAF